MNAMLSTYPANSMRRRHILSRAAMPLSLWQALREAEMERRHRTLVQLEDLYRNTPWYCVRQRHFIRRTIATLLP
ncbi:MAG TPA: hypothetical protein DEP82_14930 [Arthrobacter bacterium]|jgi:hypothetical protein|nr:hypothetical protein [Arthrobacter sp.]